MPSFAYGSTPFSITRRTRRGVKMYDVYNFFTRETKRCSTKKEATAAAKDIERRWLNGEFDGR